MLILLRQLEQAGKEEEEEEDEEEATARQTPSCSQIYFVLNTQPDMAG